MKVKLYQTFTRPDLSTLMYHPDPKFGRYLVDNYERTGLKTCPCGEPFEESHHPPVGTSWCPQGYWPEEDADKLSTNQYTEFTSRDAWEKFMSDPTIQKMRQRRDLFNQSRGIVLTARVEYE